MRKLASALVLMALCGIAAADDDGETDGGGASAATVMASGSSGGRPVDKGAFGVGIVLGEPTGLCAKLYLDDDTAIQGGVGFNFYDSGIQLNADFVLHPWIVQERDAFVLPLYIGPGVRFIQYKGARGEDEHYALGLRGVFGMLFDFKEVPLDVFLEVAGVVEWDFTKDGGVALNLGAGARYYF
jgi:hypothetical protein